MPLISKLFGMWVIGKTVSNTTPIFIRLLLGMVTIAVFAVFTALLTGILIVGSIWFGYYQLVEHGFDTQSAALIIGGVLILLIVILMISMKHKWRTIHSISDNIVAAQSPVASRVTEVTGSFMRGYRSPVSSSVRKPLEYS